MGRGGHWLYSMLGAWWTLPVTPPEEAPSSPEMRLGKDIQQ